MQQKTYAFLALLALVFVGTWLPITDPTESNYVLTAKEMLAAGDLLSPRIYGNYWYDKPIFFYWELIAAFAMLGTSDFAARLFPALFSIANVLLAYAFAKRLYGARTGFFAALIFATTVEFFYLSKAVITDMTLLLFFDATLLAFWIGYTKDRRFYRAAFALAGLAVLTKGPIGLLLPGLIVLLFLLAERRPREFLRLGWGSGLLLFFLVSGPWYLAMYLLHGADFARGFLGVNNILRATVSEHPKFDVWYYYIVIFFAGFFPWSLAILPSLLARLRAWLRQLRARPAALDAAPYASDSAASLAEPPSRTSAGTSLARRARAALSLSREARFLLIWAATVELVFSLMATKYVTYTLPALLPLAILAARLLARARFVRTLAACAAACYIALAFALAPAQMAQHSGKDTAAALAKIHRQDRPVMSYGFYRASTVYYYGGEIRRLATKGEIERMKPSGISWNALNVMPFAAIEDLPAGASFYVIARESDLPALKRALPDAAIQKEAQVHGECILRVTMP